MRFIPRAGSIPALGTTMERKLRLLVPTMLLLINGVRCANPPDSPNIDSLRQQPQPTEPKESEMTQYDLDIDKEQLVSITCTPELSHFFGITW